MVDAAEEEVEVFVAGTEENVDGEERDAGDAGELTEGGEGNCEAAEAGGEGVHGEPENDGNEDEGENYC